MERAQEPRLRSPQHAEDALLRRTELIISVVLRGGVFVSAGIILIGVVGFYARDLAGGARGVDPRAYPRSLGAVLSGVAHRDPLAVIALGLLVLIATPVLRVAVSIVTFALERDWVYVLITALVLCILIASFLLGAGGA
jgi:uncharacterized membrane protein